MKTTRSHIPLIRLTNFASIFSPNFWLDKSQGGQNSFALKKSLMKFAFHEQEVAGASFHPMVEGGRVNLHMENSSGRESSVDLIGTAFALPRLCYSESGWQRRGMYSGPSGWAVCHDSASPVYFSDSFTTMTCGFWHTNLDCTGKSSSTIRFRSGSRSPAKADNARGDFS